jgi:serine/threonine-protein kinase
MPEKIGKYEILARIGRGGMGTIFKARDPVLDRVVALKVISSEIELTDELRARFFREAQACARLNHPNIVTVYDMGEDDALFIVMEFLEGEELRRLITQRRELAIEDKLSVMIQVCGGLHYAHQNGVVHRDIKPSNIMLLHSGQAKILDFGIAQVANTEAGLTRTGLIMGTLRYISPEQVRGRADHRSDMFSAGAVFYELLALRPPFIGEDPMQILEQLRADDPPALVELDPTIPPDLAAIVERAMRKDPAERFGDLQEMRGELERVQHALGEEAQRARGRIRTQRERLGTLQAELAARLGAAPAADPPTAGTQEGNRLATLRTLERDLATRIEEAMAQIARVDLVAPGLERATELLDAGEFAAAVVEFETILADIPGHPQALEGLARAQARVEEDRRRRLAAQLLQDARKALDERGYTLSLELLKQAADISPPPDAVREIAALRETLEAALAAQEATRVAQQRADQARGPMAAARDTALREAASHYAHDPWGDGEAKSAEAEEALGRQRYEDARRGFDAAAAAYRLAATAAQEAKRREAEAAREARAEAAARRERARAAEAPRYAAALWGEAEAKVGRGEEELARAPRTAAGIFSEAHALFERAEAAAREARQRDRDRALHAREQSIEARRVGEAEGVPTYASALWREAVARLAEAEAALAREIYEDAERGFEAAASGYRRAADAASEERAREHAALERAEQVGRTREHARAAGAPQLAPDSWEAAEAKLAEGRDTLSRRAFAAAASALSEAERLYARAEEAAREATAERERLRMVEARELASQSRGRSQRAGAPTHARELWDAAEAKLAEAQAALDAGGPGRAAAVFEEVVRLHGQAERAADEARELARRRADAAREQAVESRRRAEAVGAEHHAPALWNEASARSTDATAAISREEYTGAVEAFDRAAALFHRAASEAEEVRRRARAQADDARRAARHNRDAALSAEAPAHAASDWSDAEQSAASGEAHLARGAFAEARVDFDRGAQQYQRAEGLARAAAQALAAARAEVDKAERTTAHARGTAVEAQAPKYAPTSWTAGESASTQARGALDRADYQSARSLLAEARRQYAAAARAADIAVEAETRRADAMLGDARRLLEADDVEACLSRLHEVLTLRPAHPAAEQLRLDAESRRRELRAAAERATSAVDVVADRDQTHFQEDRRASAESATEVVRAPEPVDRDATVVAQLATGVEAKGTSIPVEDEATKVLEVESLASPIGAGEPVTVVPPRAPSPAAPGFADAARASGERAGAAAEGARVAEGSVSGAVSPALRSERGPAIDRKPAESPVRSRIRGRHALIAALGVMAVIALAGGLWRFASPPAAPPSMEGLRRDVAAARASAHRAGAQSIAAFGIANDKERAADAAFRQRDFGTADQRYREALAGFQRAGAEAEQRSAALASRSRVADARKAAEAAGAPKRATSLWDKAEGVRREAESALEQQAFERAQALFAEASGSYGEAQRVSLEGMGRQQREEAERARAPVASARQAAERADARRLASAAFAAAQQREDEAADLLSRGESSPATAGFQEALRQYKQAAQEASAQRVAELRAMATRARERMGTAAREAEQDAAAQRAPVLFGWAQEKDRGAATALQASDYSLAERLFSEARADYEVADREAKRATGPASAQTSAEQARRRSAGYRDRAAKAEAERLVADLYSIAQAKEGGADELINRRSFALATQAYKEAGDQYLAAIRRADDRRDADAARGRMGADKQQANQTALDYKSALAEETLGASAYERLSYREAAARFQTAQTLYAKAGAPPAARPPSSANTR